MKKFSDLNILQKIILTSSIACLAVLLVIGKSALDLYTATIHDRHERIQALTQSAMGVIQEAYADEVSNRKTRAQAQEDAKSAIGKMRYAGDNYFWINDMAPNMIMHPTNPQLNGTNLSSFKDPHGTFLFNEFVKTVKNQKEGFVEYFWPKPGNDQPILKISYVSGFEPWGWVLGTGLYVDDVKEIVTKGALSTGLFGGLLLSLSIFMALFLARRIVKPLHETIHSMNQIMDERLSITLPSVKSHDEVSQLIDATHKLYQHTQENLRSKTSLSSMTSCVMMLDTANNISQMNPAMINLFEHYDEILKTIGIHTNALQGTSLDLFSQFSTIPLKDIQNTLKGKIQCKGLHFDIQVSPVFNKHRDRLGSIIEWIDRTQEISTQQEIEKLLDEASQGRLDYRISLENKEGFTKNLSLHMNQLLDTLTRVFDDMGGMFNHLSQGDLTTRIYNKYSGSFHELAKNANETAVKLESLVGDMIHSSHAIQSIAQEVASSTQDLSARTEQAASNLEETAASMEEISSSVKENASHTDEASRFSSSSLTLAQKGGQVVNEAMNAMDEIKNSAAEITSIMTLIDDIAFQTNLLALNAAVEAARAGESGKGFAVVAGEVRSLAQRSSEASKQIKNLITTSQNHVTHGAALVHQTGQHLGDIVISIKGLSQRISGVANATKEQSIGLEQINTVVSHMDEMTQQNAALVQKNYSYTEQLQKQATHLQGLTGQFRINKANYLPKDTQVPVNHPISFTSHP
jgi:methyl-accepting chemotaxis protein